MKEKETRGKKRVGRKEREKQVGCERDMQDVGMKERGI